MNEPTLLFLALPAVLICAGTAAGAGLGYHLGYDAGANRTIESNQKLRLDLAETDAKLIDCENWQQNSTCLWGPQAELMPAPEAGPEVCVAHLPGSDWVRLSIFAKGDLERGRRFVHCWKDVTERCGLNLNK
jgi:hypothetical protein